MPVFFKKMLGYSILFTLFFPKIGWSSTELQLNGASLTSYFWLIPFCGMLLSIALGPLLCTHFWEKNFGKISLFWALFFVFPCVMFFGIEITAYQVWHTLLLEYIPFIILLFSLFTIAGGVRLTGTLKGSPAVNTSLLAIGALLSSFMGTTGSAMLLIRPLLRANEHRKYRTHSVVFFIFLVANIGGLLSPLGDPPLFLGFLKGVSFFWTTKHLFFEYLFATTTLLVLYFFVDLILYRKESKHVTSFAGSTLGVEGKINLFLLVGVVGSVLMSGSLKLSSFSLYHVSIEYQNLIRDGLLLLLSFLSLALTSKTNRDLNSFSWEPIKEVIKLFFGIFISMIPVIAILQAGEKGSMAHLVNMVNHNGQPVNSMYFWLTGLLSSLLDNAPTYVVFFNTAGGDATKLMGDFSGTLKAISVGAVFMGANTYIGNAPNFMVRSIAENQGIKMPSFFGYMLWALVILIPLFILMTYIFIV